MNKEIEKILVDLLKTYLALPDNYGKDEYGNEIPVIVIRGQNAKLFNTPHMQITISTLSTNVFANRREFLEELVTTENNQQVTIYKERVCINEQRQMQIDVYSRTNEARQRFWEVQAALNSTYSQQLQDKYQFRISKMSNSFNTTGLEGGSDINRFTIRFNCLTWQEKVTPIDYYNSFPVRARTSNENIFANFKIENNEIIDIPPQIVWTQDYSALVNYSEIASGEYEQWQGGFSNYTNFTENDGGFLTYKIIKDSYKY